MKKISTKIHCIRIWNEDSAAIKQKYFLKGEALFGSDKKSDIRMARLKGLHARFDFITKELHLLDTGEVRSVEPGALFQLGTTVFQWKEFSWWNQNIQMSLIAGAIGVIVLSGALAWGRSQKPLCSTFALKVSSGAWAGTSSDPNEKFMLSDLQNLKKSFQGAVKEKNWTKARAELTSIQQILMSIKADASCHLLEPLSKFELKLSEHLIMEHLQNSEPELAAKELARIPSQDSTKREHWEKKIRRAAGKLYLEGYEEEDDDLEKANDLIEQAQGICLAMHLDAECYRGNHRSSKQHATMSTKQVPSDHQVD